jgi:PAS domain S-box-containing protein
MTRTNEPMAPEALAREYAAALRDYVSTGSEAALTSAYELGRAAAGGGLGILELAILHHEALRDEPRAAGADRSHQLVMAAQFLAEALSPFEMTLRSYRANARLLGLSEVLAEQNAEIDRARQQLRTILDATTAVIYLKDAEGRYLYVNRQFQQVFGRRSEEVVGKRDDDVLPREVAPILHRDDAQVLVARAPVELEELIPSSAGPRAYLSLKFPLLDANGAAYGVCCVATDITERKRADEALQRAREAAQRERQLRATLEARDRFLDIASHELKTPLTSLELQVASLRRLGKTHPAVPVSEERVQAKCDVVLRQVDRLKVLINGLIDVGRISSGHLQLSREPLELGALVLAVLQRSEEALQRSGSEIAFHASGPVVGTWDGSLVESVVAQLVTNAVKFGDGKPIEVAVGVAGDRAVLTVRDHGIGISAEHQGRIFERFERAVSERNYGGFGVGLWVARQAIEAQGGAIRVASQLGAGSEFTVELPLEPPPPAW